MTSFLDYAAVLRAAQTADPSAVVDVLSVAARDMGATDLVFYVIDFEQQVLEPLPDRAAHAELSTTEDVTATMAGRAFLSGQAVTAERDNGTRVWVPVIEGSDRTGVLAMTVPSADAQSMTECVNLGLLAGYLIATHTRTTDLYQLHRRRKAMTLAASLQWDLLPPLVLRAERCSVAALLEPAYEVGGDSFDYALNGDVLDIALIDAMGHGVRAAAIASLVVGTYRHGRREGRPLTALHTALNDVLEEHLRGEGFATGQLAKLALGSGELTWTNAGHPAPLLVRGGKVIRQLETEPSLPWGLGEAGSGEVGTEALEPGDGVLFFTDGVIEARTENGEEFGIDRLTDLVGQYASDQLPPAEIIRRVVQGVLEHRHVQLRDDATLLLVEWGPPV